MDARDTVIAFYEAFRRKDYPAMQALYADKAIFSDPVFPGLTAPEARAMWAMLLSRSKDIRIDFAVDEANGHTVAARWTAIYTFTATGRHVVNHVRTSMEVINGLITRQTDAFDFAKWSRQALGWQGYLLGKTSFLRKKIRKTAAASLQSFMQQAAG